MGGLNNLIPQLTADGRLPVGRWQASLTEVHEVFVAQAPHRGRRQMIFDSLNLYASILTDLFEGSVTLWVDGGFVTHKPDPPKDVDVVVIVDRDKIARVPTIDQLAPLLTLQDIREAGVLSQRIELDRLQPMGGLVDGFLAVASNAALLAQWDDWWSQVNGSDGERKGYLEVVT